MMEEENVEAGNSANGEQEIKESTEDKIEKQVKKGEEPTVLAPQQIQEHSIEKENTNETKALEQKGFHVIGEDGYQSGGAKNKESVTGPSIIKATDNGHLELQKEEQERFSSKKSKKS